MSVDGIIEQVEYEKTEGQETTIATITILNRLTDTNSTFVIRNPTLLPKAGQVLWGGSDFCYLNAEDSFVILRHYKRISTYELEEILYEVLFG